MCLLTGKLLRSSFRDTLVFSCGKKEEKIIVTTLLTFSNLQLVSKLGSQKPDNK